jgi:L-galactose dehydrogenase/L-glyceraldehyde 3-phosphate reductase
MGCGAVGGLMVRGDLSDQRRSVARALDAGINYFDTAPSYGDGRSEENLGRALRSLGNSAQAQVGTKVSLAPGDLAQPEKAVRRSLEDSLRRLGRDSVDLFQLHNPLRAPGAAEGHHLDRDFVLDEVAGAMSRIVEQGLAGHIGFTGLGDTESVRRTALDGPFETVQTYFNAINPSAVWAEASGGEQDFEGFVGAAAERGLGVINIRVYAAGALAGDVPRHPLAGQMGDGRGLVDGAGYVGDVGRSGRLSSIAAELGLESTMELGLRFAIAAPGISTVLVGLSSFEQLEAALRWNDRGPLHEAEVSRVIVLARA